MKSFEKCISFYGNVYNCMEMYIFLWKCIYFYGNDTKHKFLPHLRDADVTLGQRVQLAKDCHVPATVALKDHSM
jgi:hypothetical protein